ncbi:MAG TPA: pilus assembly protein PilP [Burkholderiales bacterium]|nr:pilus assembly protein PilP [Burkholderiales bacterium]
MRWIVIVFAAMAALTLGGCSGAGSLSDLRQFVKNADKLPHGKIPPLPEVQPYQPFQYTAFDIPNPFEPRQIKTPKTAGSKLKPDFNRRREPLEAYALESLKMVGTLERDNKMYALVLAPDHNLFYVASGNYIGQDFGRITQITDSEIKLKELVQDSSGDWTRRASALQLIDTNKTVAKK